MKYTYEINQDLNVIKRTDENGSVDSIPMTLENSDYQAYLESLEPKAKTSKVVNAPVFE